MSSDTKSNEKTANLRDGAKTVSNDAFRLLRLNLLLIGLYLTVGKYISDTSNQVRQEILTSNYTMAAAVFLLMSIMVGYLTYESATRLAAIDMYDNRNRVLEKYTGTDRLVFNIRYAVLLSLASGLAFAIGVLEGYIPGGISPVWVWQFVFALLVITSLPVIAVYLGLRILSRIRAVWEYF